MLLIAWGAGIWQDYIQTKGWQTEARLVSNWTSAARSYIGKNYTTLQGSSTTTTPAVITTTMLKNTGFLSSGFTETNSEGQRLQAYVVRNAQNPELLQAMVVSSGGTPYPVKALIQMAKDITTGLGGYIQDGKTATGALRSWSVALSNYGAKSGNGHIAVLLSTDELSGAAEDTDRLYRFQVNGRPDLNKMHTAIDMGSNNLNNVGAVNAQTGNFSGNVNGVNGTFSGQVKGNSGNFDVNVTAGGDIRSNNGWLPPVIDEAQDVAHITPDQIRTSSRVWTIIRPERFVSNPPGWRDWLLRGLSTTATPGTEGSVVPEDSVQRKVWETALRQGWQEGRQNADLTLEANQKTLTRDYRGMMLYSLLWRQGMITRPDVSDQMQTVTGDGKKLVTGDRVRRLKNHAEFNLQKSHWRPLIGTEGGSR
ncbi:shufflon system plasmid conjugative transfer pilus tip adhesin PilV [Escherichia coli]|nr:shufflon system plasmid conjugative transfer pilus tip adhesin PilV [Escherichia coli]